MGPPVHQELATWRAGLEFEAPWMRDLASHLVRGEDAARELVQDAWLTALERPPRDRGRPRAWLRQVMQNLVRQRARRAWVRGRAVGEAPEAADPAPLPGHELERSELEALLARELERLEEPYRATLREHFVRGLSCAAIARRDGLPQGTVRWRLKEGLDRMRARLDGRFGGRRRWIGAFAPLLVRRDPPARWSPGLAAALGAAALVPLAALTLHFVQGASPQSATDARLAAHRSPVEPAVRGQGERRELPGSLPARAPVSVDAPAPGPPAASPHELSVRVLDEDGVPVAGAEIRVATAGGFEPRGVTDAGGSALVPFSPGELGALGIPATSAHLSLRAFAPGRAASDVLHVPRPDDETEPVTLQLGGEERILHGLARDADGQPLAGVEVFVLADPNQRSTADVEEPFAEPHPLATRTADDGRYELAGLARREYVLGAALAGRETVLFPLGAAEDEADLELSPGGVVRGRILDENGAPAAGVRVWVEPLHRGTEWCTGLPGYRPDQRGFGRETVTGADGRYELGGLLARRRRLFAQAVGDPALVATGIVSVPARGAAAWDATLQPKTGIHLALAGERGEPLAGWIVQLGAKPEQGLPWVRWLRTDGNGRVDLFDDVGEAELVVYDPAGQGEPWLTRKVRPGEAELALAIQPDRFARAFGRIVDAGGTPLREGVLTAFHENTRVPVPIAVNPRNGRFDARLEAGEYTLLLRAAGGAAWLAELALLPGERHRIGLVRLPPEGELAWRAERRGSGQENYRLEMCFGRGSLKVREGALPVTANEAAPPGLYRLDVSGGDGVLQSAWSCVEPGALAELDLERQPLTVRVEVRGASLGPGGSGPIGLAVAAPHGSFDVEPPGAVRCVQLRPRADGRYLHVLRLPLGEWRLQARSEAGTSAETSLRIGAAGTVEVVLELSDAALVAEK